MIQIATGYRGHKTMIKEHKKTAGFTLIEMAITLTILGLVLAPLFGYLTMQSRQEQARKEEEVNSRILSALALYVRQNGHYPCPANPQAVPGDANYGLGGGTPGVSCPNASTSGGIAFGTIPTRDIGLPFRLMSNRYGYKYIYAVTMTLTGDASLAGSIRVNEPAGMVTNMAPFALVNPGSDGKGVYPESSATIDQACGSTALDSENCDNDNVFFDADYSDEGSPSTATYYDDTLVYSLASQDSTFWLMSQDAIGPSGKLNVINRNDGNVGIGDFSGGATINDKLHVRGGDVRVDGDASGVGGNVIVEKDIDAENVSAGQNVSANGKVQAPRFLYSAP